MTCKEGDHVGKRLSGYAVFALFFLIVVKAVRFFVRQPGGGMDCFFLAAFAAFWDIWRGRPRGGAPIPQDGSEADSISFDFAGSCHRLLFADGLPGVCNAQAGYSPALGARPDTVAVALTERRGRVGGQHFEMRKGRSFECGQDRFFRFQGCCSSACSS